MAPPKYRTVRAIHGFIESNRRVVTIPPGEIVIVAFTPLNSTGLCSIKWDEQFVEAFYEDVMKNSTLASDE